MYSEKYSDTINACRFCFMCRHLSPVGNVTYRESDTPRVRALMIDRIIKQPELLANADYLSTLYDADLSAACRQHCVNHYDEAGLVLAARRDAVEGGHVPDAVKKVADALKAQTPVSKGDTNAEVIYYVDPYTERYQPEIVSAMGRILKVAGVNFRILSGADTGKALAVLGFYDAAKEAAGKLAALIRGGGKRTLITSCPASLDSFKNDFAKYGLELGGDVEVLHTAEFLLRLVKTKKLSPTKAAVKALYPVASDYLRNYSKGFNAHELLLQELGVKACVFGFNTEESYSVGEGAVVLDELNPALVRKLVSHVAEQVDDPAADTLLVLSPYTKYALRQFGAEALQTITVEELVANSIKE